MRVYWLWTRAVYTWQSGQGTRACVEVPWSVISAVASSMCHASRDSVVLSGKKRVRRARIGVETKAGSSSAQGINEQHRWRVAPACVTVCQTMSGYEV